MAASPRNQTQTWCVTYRGYHNNMLQIVNNMREGDTIVVRSQRDAEHLDTLIARHKGRGFLYFVSIAQGR